MKTYLLFSVLSVLYAAFFASFIASAAEEADPFKNVEQSNDVVWLEKIAGSLEEAGKTGVHGGLAQLPKDLRAAAYARLGEIGSEESLAAVERIENKYKKITVTPQFFSLDMVTHPAWHYGDGEAKLLCQVKGTGKTTYGIIFPDMMGGANPFLVSNENPEDKKTWTRPRLIPERVVRFHIHDVSLTFTNNDVLVFSFEEEKALPRKTGDKGIPEKVFEKREREIEIEISIPEIMLDSDKDGWTDIEETRLGLDPKKADTDGDGLKDGDDPTPNYAPGKDDKDSDEVEIIQKAIFAAFGLSDSRRLLIVGEKSRNVQVWGYCGPVIYGINPEKWREEHGYGVIEVNWDAKIDGVNAKVYIKDYEGSLAAGSQYIIFEKKNGKWVVVKREFGEVS
jgi:hypothetical protein